MSCQRFVIIDLSCTITWRILICHEKWSNLTNLFQSLSLQHFNSSFSFFNLFFSFINLYCILTLICHVTVRKHTCNKQTIQIVNIFVSFNRTSKFLRKQIKNTSNPANTCQQVTFYKYLLKFNANSKYSALRMLISFAVWLSVWVSSRLRRRLAKTPVRPTNNLYPDKKFFSIPSNNHCNKFSYKPSLHQIHYNVNILCIKDIEKFWLISLAAWLRLLPSQYDFQAGCKGDKLKLLYILKSNKQSSSQQQILFINTTV